MSKWLDRLRDRLRRFLGLNELAVLPEAQALQRIGAGLLQVHRVFGDPARLQLGKHVILNDALINTTSGRVQLDDYAFCGHAVSLLTGTHEFRNTGYMRQAGVPQEGRDIVIGRHAVIAAGAVVTGDVEEASIYAGVPARRIAAIDLRPEQKETT
jgi:acetyltransferase-like isoleucine patch superfamily enzyme